MSEGGGDEALSSLNSPRSRVKFLCSHGGKILPRAVDGNLKYVGGETRVVAVPREINFSGIKFNLLYFNDKCVWMLLNSPEPFEFHCGFWKMNGLD